MSVLVIVESPGKTKKISKFLGKDYNVVASVGHIRQLADTADDNTGVTLSSTPPRVDCEYAPIEGASRRIQELKRQARTVSQVILATDPDREGESIAWHLWQVLGLSNPQRARFSEITQTAVQQAVNNPEPLDQNLAAAARAREVLDKLVGYKLSPLLWQLENGAKSAGRCQSVALHLLCQREKAIASFQPLTYWVVEAEFLEGFIARYEDNDDSRRIFDYSEASAIAQAVRESNLNVTCIHRQEQKRNPPPPLTTATLQQLAGNQLGFSAKETMQVAQKLYEAGAITYHRTDSVTLSPEFVQLLRKWLQSEAPDCLPPARVKHRSRGGQEAHEAIRPTQINRRPSLSGRQQELYSLIWARAIASECTAAVIENVSIEIEIDVERRLVARGHRRIKAGYTHFWDNLKTDNALPKLVEGQSLNLRKVTNESSQTLPPQRLSEPELISTLESSGVGRPSTYAAIVETLIARKYVSRQQRQLEPTQLGKEVDDFLLRVVPQLLEPAFTARMEKALDTVASGERDWQSYIVHWYQQEFLPALEQGQEIAQTEFATPEDKQTNYVCQMCGTPGLTKHFSNNPKLEVDHYLKCRKCNSPHFWNEGDYQLPYRLRRRAQSKSENLTSHQCPACDSPLELHQYQLRGIEQKMLRCSQLKKPSCDRVAYFPFPGGWRSKHHGTIVESQTADFSGVI